MYPCHSSMDRIAALRTMLEANPANHFARYGLALELVKIGDDRSALAEFRRIMADNPDYQAAYFHAGKALERLGEGDEARAIYVEGVKASFRTGNTHARSELEAAIEEIPT